MSASKALPTGSSSGEAPGASAATAPSGPSAVSSRSSNGGASVPGTARTSYRSRPIRPRTPERTLLLLGLVGGWPGAVLAQQWLRHKTSKRSFQQMFWFTVLVNVAGFLWLSSRLAAA